MLDISNAGNSDGANVQVYTANNSNAQKFILVPAGSSSFRITPLCAPGRAVDDSSAAGTPGSNVHLWSYLGAANQRWYLEEVDYTAFSVYRDGVWLIEWHAALMDKTAYSSPVFDTSQPVVHTRGANCEPQLDEWPEFMKGNSYMGVFKPKFHILRSSGQSQIRNKARELTCQEIGYTTAQQLRPKNTFIGYTKIEPQDIALIRCDGIVEYCYEYYGYRVWGSDSGWNISTGTNHSSHILAAVTPKHQAQSYLYKVTYELPAH